MSGWRFISRDIALAIHDEQINEHGGPAGVRDLAMLDSALARAPNIAGYEPDADVCKIAAAYAFGIARNHPFVDGNKRTALVLCELFLELNGATLSADDPECIAAMLDLASGAMTEEALADWLRDNTTSA